MARIRVVRGKCNSDIDKQFMRNIKPTKDKFRKRQHMKAKYKDWARKNYEYGE